MMPQKKNISTFLLVIQINGRGPVKTFHFQTFAFYHCRYEIQNELLSLFHTLYHIKVSLYGIRYELLSSFYLHRVSLDEINPDAQADLAVESYANYKGQSGMIFNSVLSKLTVTQLNIQCTLLVVASQTYSVFKVDVIL